MLTIIFTLCTPFVCGNGLTVARTPASSTYGAGLDALLAFPYVAPTRLGEVLIDGSIAVIVYIVTGLFDSRSLPFTHTPIATLHAGLHTNLTRTDCTSTTSGKLFVGFSIAVVVQVIAEMSTIIFPLRTFFVLGIGLAHARPEFPGDTGFLTKGAFANIGTTDLGDPLVDGSVTIVV